MCGCGGVRGALSPGTMRALASLRSAFHSNVMRARGVSAQGECQPEADIKETSIHGSLNGRDFDTFPHALAGLLRSNGQEVRREETCTYSIPSSGRVVQTCGPDSWLGRVWWMKHEVKPHRVPRTRRTRQPSGWWLDASGRQAEETRDISRHFTFSPVAGLPSTNFWCFLRGNVDITGR